MLLRKICLLAGVALVVPMVFTAPAQAQAETPLFDDTGQITVTWDGPMTEYPGHAVQFFNMGEYERVEPYFRRVVQERIRLFGEDDRQTLVAVNNYAAVLRGAGRPLEAVRVLREWAPRAMEALGPRDMHSLTMLGNLGVFTSEVGTPAEAIAPLEQSTAGLLEVLGPDHDRTMASQMGLAAAYYAAGQIADAMAILEPLLEQVTRVQGPESRLAQSLTDNLGTAYQELGYFEQAETLLRRVLAIRDVAIVGDQPVDYYQTLSDIAVLEYRMGRFDEALADALEAERGLGGTMRPDHPTLLNLRNTRANIYAEQARYFEAEALMVANLADYEAALGADNVDAIAARGNLASLYRRQGRLREAIDINRQVVDAYFDVLGPDHPVTLNAANNLASSMMESGDLDGAVALLDGSLLGAQEVLGPDHPATIALMANLASAESQLGNHARTATLLREALDAEQARSGGDDSTASLRLRGNLAAAQRNLGFLDQAEEGLASVLEVRDATLGPDHIRSIQTAAALADVRLRQGEDLEATLAPARAAVAGLEYRRALSGSIAAEEQASREFIDEADVYLVLADALWWAEGEPEVAAAHGELTEVLQLAVEGATSRSVRQMAATRFAGEAGERIGQLATRRQELVDLYEVTGNRLAQAISRADAAGREQAAALRAQQAQVESELNTIDRQLEADFPEYFALIRPEALSGMELRALFGDGEAGLLLVPGEHGTHALVMRSGGITWRRLAVDRDQVDRMVRRLLMVSGADVGASDADWAAWEAESEGQGDFAYDRDTAFALYNELLAPLLGDLDGVEQLYVAAAGELSRLPLAMLVTAEPEGLDGSAADLRATSWFADQFAISQLPSMQSLHWLRRMAQAAPIAEGRRVLGFGDPVLSGAGAERGQAARGIPRRDAGSNEALLAGLDESGQPAAVIEKIRALASLPGTAQELLAIRNALGLGESDIYLGERSTEANFRNAGAGDAAVLVFATHGLIAGEVDGVTEPALVFTPPREFADNTDDGLLTASEIAGLRLSAEWVILSACNTAAGDSSYDNAGLSGLARSFFHAGAQSMLASYWPVFDEVAAEMTVRVLELMQENPGMSRAQALQQVMRETRDNPQGDREGFTWAHPAAWAAFGLIGDGSL